MSRELRKTLIFVAVAILLTGAAFLRVPDRSGRDASFIDQGQKFFPDFKDPLTKTYVDNYNDYDTKTRVALIKLLASFRDKRTEPALKKAFEEFAKKPSGSKDEADIKTGRISITSPIALGLPVLHLTLELLAIDFAVAGVNRHPGDLMCK